MRAAPRSLFTTFLALALALGAPVTVAAAQNGEGAQNGKPARSAEGGEHRAAAPGKGDGKPSSPIRLDGVAARVEGEVITWQDVRQEIGNVMKTMGFPSQAEREQALERIAYNKLRHLVVNELLLKRAKDEGVQVPLDRIEAAFQRDVKSVGSLEEFEKVLAEQGLTVQDKKEQIHKRLLREYYLASTRQRTPWSTRARAYTLQVRPADMRDYYKAHRDDFRDAAAVWIRKAHISAAEHGGAKKVEALAEAVVADLKKGVSPAEVDAKHGLGADQFTCAFEELDPLHADSGFLRTVLDWAFGAEKGAVYGPLALRSGDRVIFYLEKRQEEVVRSFAEVQDQIRTTLLNQIWSRYNQAIQHSLLKKADLEPRELKAFMLDPQQRPRMPRKVLVALLDNSL